MIRGLAYFVTTVACAVFVVFVWPLRTWLAHSRGPDVTDVDPDVDMTDDPGVDVDD